MQVRFLHSYSPELEIDCPIRHLSSLKLKVDEYDQYRIWVIWVRSRPGVWLLRLSSR